MRTLQEIADKLDREGGIEAGFYYFGRELDSVDPNLNMKWRIAYDALGAVSDLLPEPTSDPGVE